MLNDSSSVTSLRYYGISPWEIEVIYGLFSHKFKVIQEETEQIDTDFVSGLTIIIPVQFSEEFFKWFEFRVWDKVKHIIKEMKRRRGKGNAIKVKILFTGDPDVKFVIDLCENHNFNSAIEKIDLVVELLPYHLKESNIPNGLSEVVYKYDIESGRWRMNSASLGQKKFIITKKGWKTVT